jgi:hypothetical protein
MPAVLFDVDLGQRSPTQLTVAIMSTDNFDAAQLAVEDIEVKAFDQDGQFLGYVEITNTRVGDVDGDGDEDLGIALQAGGTFPYGSLITLADVGELHKPNQGLMLTPLIE